ncbi:MAG: carboxypeptidase regulatory-like domain-containing protein [Acidobacteria bacterium]|nr:carboxypeptidase regulatory-like domain-containing protein [Acidobacteriota bacterium]
MKPIRIASVLLLIWLLAMPLEQAVGQGTTQINGGGMFRDVQGRPAAGATVQITNDRPDRRSFRFVTDENGAFRFENLPLTPMVRLVVSWNAFHQVVDLQTPREHLEGEGIILVLQPVRASMAGKVVLNDGGQDQPVPYARVFAVREAEEVVLGATDEMGVLNLAGVPLEEFGNPSRGTIRVELPDALTLGGRFEPGPLITREIDLTSAASDLGTLRFRRVPNSSPTVRLAGFLYVRDSLDLNKSKPIDGLILRAVNATSGQVAAETTVREGRWSLTIPRGSYVFEASNAAELGFLALSRNVRRVEFGREDLRNGLNRFIPEVLSLQSQRLIFTYPDIPGLPVQGVVLRVNDRVVDLVSSVGRDGNRYTVTLTNALQPGDGAEVAVMIDGLLTLFSVSRAVEGGAQ